VLRRDAQHRVQRSLQTSDGSVRFRRASPCSRCRQRALF
jgi:hypothetical protein